MTKSNLERRRLIWCVGYSSSSGKLRQEVKADPRSSNYEDSADCRVPGSHSAVSSVAQSHLFRDGTTHSGLGSTTSVSSQENILHTHFLEQSVRQFSPDISFPDDSRFVSSCLLREL